MKILFIGSLIFSLSQLTFASESIHWGYDKELAPEHWGELSDNFKTCQSGKNQTPINITNTYKSKTQHKINIHYNTSPHDIIFNGHTVQVNAIADDQSDFIVVDHEKYFLKQFHFHTPSENEIHGKSYPLELHFVNANAKGQLSVLAVMFNIGKANTEWKKLWANLSPIENEDKVLAQAINLKKLLPQNYTYYRFSGSLTTPPCSEGVNWIVFKTPLTLSKSQLEAFKARLSNHDNHRPIQPTNGRIIIED